METLIATVVFIPLSILVVEAAFSATIYPTTILNSLTVPHSDKLAQETNHQQRSMQNEGFIGQSGQSTPVRDHINLQYYTSINVGLPLQLFRAPIDISSSDLLVFSSQCQTETCEGPYKYNSSCSTTYQGDGAETLFECSCFRGEGLLKNDTLYIAGLEIKNQKFQELPIVHQTWTGLYTPKFDTVLCLAPGKEITYRSINYNQCIGDPNHTPLSKVTHPDCGPNDPSVK